MRLFTNEEETTIVNAIRVAEARTTGEIRVYVEDFCMMDDALARAYEVFTAYRMEKTEFRNAVLIYIAQRSRQFAILGDQAMNEKSGGNQFWKREKTRFKTQLKSGHYCDAVVCLVQDVGDVLHTHFPAPVGWVNKNELPDEIIYG